MTAVSHAPQTSLSQDGRTMTVHIPVTFRQRASRKQILSPSGSAPWALAPRIDTTLLKAIVRAHRWRQMLESGEYTSAAELAKAEKVNDSYLSRILRLTLLSPEIVEAIVIGKQPTTMQVDDLLKPLPARWPQQKLVLYGK
jgi:ParB-like chromosome segregation protein Spo0J